MEIRYAEVEMEDDCLVAILTVCLLNAMAVVVGCFRSVIQRRFRIRGAKLWRSRA